MKPLLPSAALVLCCLAAAHAQVRKPDVSDFWSRATGTGPKAAPPAVPSPAEVFAAFGMTGTWSPDCTKPASRGNPRFDYLAGPGGVLTGFARFGADGQGRNTVREAVVDPAGRLHATSLSRFEDLPEDRRLVLGRDGRRPSVTFATTFAKGADGSVALVEIVETVEGAPSRLLIVDGYQVEATSQARGAKAPVRRRCPNPAVAAAAAILAPPASPAAQAKPAAVPPTIAALGSDGLLAERVRFVVGGLTLTAARIELRGTGLSREDLARLLDPAAPADLRARLAAVTAREIVVPELAIEGGSTAGGVATLRDIRLSEVGAGRVGTLVAGPATATFGSPAKPGSAEFARFEATAFDLGHLIGLVAGPADAAATLGRVFAGTALEGLAVTDPDGDTVRIARVSARDYRARRTGEGVGAAFAHIGAALDGNGPPSGSDGRALAATADLLGAVEIGALDLVGIELRGQGGQSARIARIGLAAASGAPGSFRLDGFEGTSPDGTARVASFSIEEVSLRSAFDGAASAAGSGRPVGRAEIRRLVPQVGAVRLGRVEVVQAGSAAGAAPFSLDGMEIVAADPVDGLPTRLRLAMRNLSVPADAVSAQDASGQLAGLGYAAFATTVRADLGWSAASGQLALHELAVEGTGIGSATLRAVAGNVSKDLFSPDPEAAMRAALGATAQSIDLDIQDRGLLDRVLAAQAGAQSASVEDLRIEYASYARLGIPGALGDMPGGTELGQAVARFIARPGRLWIRARATQPAGIGLAEIADTADPATLLGRFTLTAGTD